jgi:hypothetical protein
MMIVPAGVKVHLALGYTDMRKGMDGLAMLVQDTLKKDAFSGHLFAFRGKRARIIKILFWDDNGPISARTTVRLSARSAVSSWCCAGASNCSARRALRSTAASSKPSTRGTGTSRKPKCSGGWRPRVTTMHGHYRK